MRTRMTTQLPTTTCCRYGLPIVDVKYHDSRVVSADSKIIKIWDPSSGSLLTSIQPPSDINDVCVHPGSGVLMAACETERLGSYFIPALGPAPR